MAEYLGESFFREHVKTHFDRCLNGETIEYSLWYEYPILGQRYVRVTYFPYRNGRNEIEGIVANTRDITHTRRLEDQQKLILDSMPLAVLVVQNGTYVYANPSGAALLGYDSSEEVVGTAVFESVPPEYRELVSERLRSFESKNKNPTNEMVIPRKDGRRTISESTSAPILFEGKPAALVLARDKTEQKLI